MTAGAVAVPTIVPLRAPYPGQHKSAVDTSTKIELHSDTEGVKIYYTLNGSKPEPFQKIGPSARATRVYRAPFTLAAGKRTVKAVAVSEDERESFVVTKVFDVEQLESDVVVSNGDDLEFMAEIPIVQQAKREVQKFADKMVTGREAWAEIQRMKYTNGTSPAVGINGHAIRENGANTLHGSSIQDHHRLNGDMSSKKRLYTTSDTLSQAADKYQEQFLKCPNCFFARTFDLTAKFCEKCGFTLPSLQRRAAPPSQDEELGPCWNCKSVIPLTMAKCLVCEASLSSGEPSLRLVGVVGDRLLCTICGTSNAPNRAATCVTCSASLRTCAKLVRQDVGNPASTQMVTLKCAQCGHYNNANAMCCSRCQAKTLSPNVVCSTCTASNSLDSQFCGTCGLALIVPPSSTQRNGSALVFSTAAPMPMSLSVNSHILPVQSVMARLDPPKCDAITQTVGLTYQSQQPNVAKSKESDLKQATAGKDGPDHKPLLTAISPGRGYWRKQMEHICGHMKAHAAVNPDFRSVVSGPRLGKVTSASVEEDGDECTIVITFKRYDNDNAARRRNYGNSDTDDNESVDELRGVSKELLRTYGSGRRSNMSSASSHDGFDSDRSANTTSRSRKASKKHLPPKSPKKVVKKTDIVDTIKDEDRKLLKEVGKNGSGEPPEIRQLIEEGANPNCVNKDGFPVLHVAVMNKQVEAIQVLVNEGAKVNAKGPNRGNTALHEAVSLGPTAGRVIDALLACGADVNAKNAKGETPYDVAVKDGQDVIVKKFSSFLGQSKLDKLTKPRPARGVNDF